MVPGEAWAHLNQALGSVRRLKIYGVNYELGEREFADLKKAEEERKTKEKIEADRRAVQNEADREAAEKHLKEVIIPLFEEVAAAARKSGYAGNVRQIIAQSVSGPNTAPFVKGVHLTLSQKQVVPGPRQRASLAGA